MEEREASTEPTSSPEPAAPPSLLGCPFCGNRSGPSELKLYTGDALDQVRARCNYCGATGPAAEDARNSFDDALRRWNIRHTPTEG